MPALLTLKVCCSPVAGAEADDPQQARRLEFFESRIRPVLVKHCYECHAADSKSLKGGLQIDSRDGLLRGGDSGPAIVPGKPDESPLIQAVRYDTFEMPPGGRLPAAVVRDLEQWVRDGAVDPRESTTTAGSESMLPSADDWWCLEPVRRPVISVETGDGALNPIDVLIRQRLTAAGLTPQSRADRLTLIRRVTFDLTGLPPTTEEVRQFLDDHRPGAWSRVVDRLLASPRFGQHWGRHWLDVVRYADSNGGDFNATFFNAWRYRDYVVQSFNADRPFEEFLSQQLAGDLMDASDDDQRIEQLVATGFLMLGSKMLSERDKDKLQMDVVDEQIDTVGRALLGITMGCARCHDHKFDPIRTEDYYALAGVFRSTQTIEGEIQKYVSSWVERELPVPAEHRQRLAAHQTLVEKAKQQQKQVEQQIEQTKQQLSLLRATDGSVTVDDVDATKQGKWKSSSLSPKYVGAGYIHDEQQERGQKSVTFPVRVPVSGQYELRMSYTHGPTRSSRTPVTVETSAGPQKLQVNQRPAPEIDGLFHKLGVFTFEADKPFQIVVSNHDADGFVIVDAMQLVPVGDTASSAANRLTDEQRQQIKQLEQQQKELAAQLKQLKAHSKQLEENSPPPIPTAMAVRDAEDVGDCHVRIRGQVAQLGDLVPRGFPEVFSSTVSITEAEQTSGRRELAAWLASPDHPLVTRVYVNRVWQHLLGEGIVRSVDNFGHLGQRPTHPELLDWLASEFTAGGGSTKRLVKTILLSDTYRRASLHDSHSAEADPDNRLLWRAHRKRLPAEAIRDSMLLLSGQLDDRFGGSPVVGYGRLAVTPSGEDQSSDEAGTAFRRSMYLPIVRNELPDALTVFDFADPNLVTGRRSDTNVPAQALFLMNSPFVRETAERVAERLQRDPELSDSDRLDRLYLQLLARAPTDAEWLAIERFLQGSQASGDSPTQDELDQRWRQIVHAVLASVEFRMTN